MTIPIDSPLTWTESYCPGGNAQSRLTSTTLRQIPNETQRQRKAHKKVRTGCLTCKIRRKKCDEAKPVCDRCTTLGIKCDGYAMSLSGSGATQTSSIEPSSAIFDNPQDCYSTPSSGSSSVGTITNYNSPVRTMTPAFSVPGYRAFRSPRSFTALDEVSDIERHCYGYFRHRTGPQIASYFESTLWWLDTSRCLTSSALFSAAVALGAVHRRASYGISREAFEWCEHAARLYSIAKARTIELKAQYARTASVVDSEAIMKCEILLCMFQTFQDDQEKSSQHLDSGIEHVFGGRKLKRTRSEARYCVASSKPRIFCQLYHRLYCISIGLFDTPINLPSERSDTFAQIPDKFESIDAARDYIFTEVWWIMSSPARWHDTVFRQQARCAQLYRLARWDQAYARTARRLERSPRGIKACSLLRLARNALYLASFLSVREDPPAKGCPPIIVPDLVDGSGNEGEDKSDGMAFFAKALFDAARDPNMLCNNLAKIKRMIKAMLDDSSIWESTTSDLPLTSTSDPSPSSFPLQTHQDRDTQVGIYTVARNVHTYGEKAILDAIKPILPDNVDIECVDTEFIFEERRLLLLRYYVPDETGTGLWWMEELWEFGDSPVGLWTKSLAR